MSDRLIPESWRRKATTVFLVIMFAPLIVALLMRALELLWAVAWPVIVLVALLLAFLGLYRLVQWWRWR